MNLLEKIIMLLALALVIRCFVMQASAADRSGHEKFHAQFYQYLNSPSGESCCNSSDCRPAQFKMTPSGPLFFVGGKWIKPPETSVMQLLTPDGMGHWCGFGESSASPITYCAILPHLGT